MQPSRRSGRSERGGSAVVAVAAMPLLLAFLFAAIDLGRIAFLGAEASTAAHAVCRYVEATPSAAAFPDRLRQAALEAAPSLGAAELELSVAAEVGDAVEREIAYRLHDDEDGSFAVRNVRARTCPIAVELSVRARYLTPLGSLLSQEGPGPVFSCTARACGTVDETARGEAT